MKIKGHLILTALLLIFILGPCFGPVARYLNSIMDIRPATAWQVIAFMLALMIVFAWTFLWMRRNGRSFADLGWIRLSKRSPLIVGALIGVLWGAFGAMGYLRFDPKADLLELSLLRVFTALLGACGATLEDMVTRAFIMNELDRAETPVYQQVIISSLIFALYHSVWWGNIPGFIGSFIASLIYGMILAGLFIWGKRSLTPVILGHSLAVIVGEPYLTMTLLAAMKGF